MATQAQLNSMKNRVMKFLHGWLNSEIHELDKCSFFMFRAKNKHKENIKHFKSILKNLGDNPDWIDVSLKVPETVLTCTV